MTARLSPQRETEMTPVGYYCDHSDEKPGERTHHDWEWVEEQGFVFQHQPDTISAHTGTDRLYLKPEDREKRCPRAVPVYTGPAAAAELAAVRAERDEAGPAALRDAADRIERRAATLGGAWLRADEVCATLRRIGAEAGESR